MERAIVIPQKKEYEAGQSQYTCERQAKEYSLDMSQSHLSSGISEPQGR